MAAERRKLTEMRNILMNVPLLSSCSKKDLSLLAGVVEEKHFPEGSQICQQGEASLGMHVVTHGAVRVDVGGRRRRRLGPGAFFGEIALFDGGRRSATVTAETAVTTLHIPAWSFKAVLKSRPELALKVLEKMAQRIRENEGSFTN